MILLRLFLEFFKIGLFSVGGGLATLPFLYELAEKTDWLNAADISNLVAISESTPGPLGINMATYVGYINSGTIGSIIAPLGLVTPSVIVIICIAGALERFRKSRIVNNVFYALRPASSALIAAAGFGVFKLAFIGQNSFFWKGAALAIVLILALFKLKKLHPVALIAFSAAVGIIFKFSV